MKPFQNIRYASLWLTLILFAISAKMAMAQVDSVELNPVAPIQSYLEKAMRFNLYSPQEKVYLHFDNTGYFKGEIIRFKAYVMRCDTQKPTDLSHVLYVELINPTGDVEESRKLRIVDGEAEGDIKVDSIMTTGFYEIRAYTRYMTNWGTHACFSRVLPIFKAPRKEGDYSRMELDQFSYRKRLPSVRVDDDSLIIDTYTHAMSVKFYPEGGDLVNGLKSKVAFTITDENGAKVVTTGTIQDEKKNTVATISTDTLGRGIFEFTPQAGHTYYAVVKNHKDKDKQYPLPTPRADGTVLTLNTLGEIDIEADIRCSLGMQGKLLGYAMMHNGTIIECDTMTASNLIHLTFNRFVLPDGVNQLTVFDSDGKIQAERLFFIYPDPSEIDSIKITSTTTRLTPCCPVTFRLQSEPNTSISLSAIDAATMTGGAEGNMKTWMLLSSEVKGYIDHPEYYFESDDDTHRRAADMLMLIQGWRRYDFTIMAGAESFELKQPIEDKLYLFGQIKSPRKKYSPDDVQITSYLYNRKGEVIEGTLTTDSIGRYTYIVPDVEGEWSLQMMSKKNDKAQNYTIGIDRHFSPATRYLYPNETRLFSLPGANFTPGTDIPEQQEDDEHVSITKKNHLLPTVKVKARRILGEMRVTWFDEEGAQNHSVLRYNCDDDADKAADLGEPTPRFYEWLESRLPVFEFERNLEDDQVTRIGDLRVSAEHTTYNNRPIIWIIDNTIFGISGLPKSKHQTIDVFGTNNMTGVVEIPEYLDEAKSVYISEDFKSIAHIIQATGLENINAVIFFVYRHPLFYSKEKGLRRTHFEGFNVPTAFEMEDYSIMPPMEDFRRTIFWAPNIKTDNRGRATIEFFNNSSCREMFISAEGLTEDGRVVVNE